MANAFTGAIKDKPGRLAAALSGRVLLDEIGLRQFRVNNLEYDDH